MSGPSKPLGPMPQCSAQEAAEANMAALWQGMTLKKILEEVDLSNIIGIDSDENKSKEISKNPGNVQHVVNPESAFLGPKIWSRPNPNSMNSNGMGNNSTNYNNAEDTYSVMNIDDFLEENGFKDEPLDQSLTESFSGSEEIQSPKSSYCDDNMDTDMVTSSPEPEVPFKKRKPEIIEQPHSSGSKESKFHGEKLFLYAESKRAKMQREKEEKRKTPQDFEFSPQELALATVPGMNFDPRECKFAPEELRPQPIIRKRKKSFVPLDAKDDEYWLKREKNNVAARRSREARRLKENQIALRTAFLEKENNQLRIDFEKIKAENLELVAEKQMLMNKLKLLESNKSNASNMNGW